jgi:uroporphyrinogen-III synthase
VKLVAISPVTGGDVRRMGYPVAAEADVFTEDGLIEAVVRLARSDPGH